MDKPMSYYAFEMLYWCGIREGELLALTPGVFDFKNSTVTINKSYQRLHGQDVITTPKTKRSFCELSGITADGCVSREDYMNAIERETTTQPPVAGSAE